MATSLGQSLHEIFLQQGSHLLGIALTSFGKILICHCQNELIFVLIRELCELFSGYFAN